MINRRLRHVEHKPPATHTRRSQPEWLLPY
jgi:hypothetical protein